eukprot:5894176-Prymnesium_polylepis.1
MDSLMSIAYEVTFHEQRVAVVDVDEALQTVVNTWQAAEDARPQQQADALEGMFKSVLSKRKSSPAGRNSPPMQLLDYGGFCELAEGSLHLSVREANT